MRARRGGTTDTRPARRPGRGWFAHSGPGGGGGSPIGGDTAADATQRQPGRGARPGRGRCAHAGEGGGHRPTGALAVAGSHTPGRGRGCLSMGMHRSTLHSACRGGLVFTRQAARPGRGWRVHAGVGGRTPVMFGAPAAVGSCNPGRWVGQGTGSRAWWWPTSARRGGGCWGAGADPFHSGSCHLPPRRSL